jgi:tetratricopeptide (TPR) repeat protein
MEGLMNIRKVFVVCACLFTLSLSLCCTADAAGTATISDEERLKKAVEAVITFHEKSGNPELAGRIRKWYASGHLLVATKSMLNSIGLDMTGADPYYWSPTGTIYIPENSLLAAVNGRGALDFAAITQLAGSMAHEMAHANDESMLSRAFLTSKAEREMSAYTKTLQSYFSGALKRNADLLKKQGGPCDKEGDAREVNNIIGEFNRYYDAEVATKDSAHQKPMEDDLKTKLATLQDAEKTLREQLEKNIGYQSISKERDAIYSEMSSLTSTGLGGLTAVNPRIEALWARIRENEKKRDLFIAMNPDLAQYRARVNAGRDAYNKANASYENYMGQDVRFQVANIRIPRLSYDDRGKASQLQAERDKVAAELQRLKQDPSHSNEVMRRISDLGDRLYELDTQLESVTVAQARTELENLRKNMNTIIENCEKEKKTPKTAAAPKEDDLMNCLCMACGGMLGGYYSKLGDCAGGCTCWGPLSGWCTPIPTGEKHAKNCYGSAYNVTNPTDADVRSLLESARASNTRATEAAIRKAIKGNQLDNAFNLGKAAKKLDPGMATPAFSELSGALKKQGWNALYKADYKTAITRLDQAVEMNPADADAKKKLSDANTYAAQWPRIESKAKEFDEYIAQKKVWSAHRSMLELQDILRPLAAGQSSENPVWKGVNDQFTKGLAWYNDFSRKSMAEWTRLFKEQEWEQAETHLKKVLTYELSPADQKQFTSSLQMVNGRLGERRSAMQQYENAKANFAKGIPADANSLGVLAKELKNREVYFNQTDPRRKQLDDLAAAMEKKQKILHAKAYAQTFFNNGDMYYRANNFEPAVTQYTEGLRAIRENGDTSDPDYAKYYKLREDAAAKDKRFRELYAYAAGLAVTDKPLDEETIRKGIGAAEEGLKIRPRNGDMEIHWNKLKWKLGELRRIQAQQQDAARKCEAKWTEGKALHDAGKSAEALAKFRENVSCAPGNRERQAYIQKLADALNRQAAAKQACLEMRRRGDSFVARKQYAEAVAAYRESLRCQPDPNLEEYIRQIEAEIKKQSDAKANAARAQQLRSEGQQLQNQGRYPEAIGKYKASLKVWPDPALSAHVAQLEKAAKKPPVKETTTLPVQVPTVAGEKAKVIFDSGNIGSVYNNPTKPTVLSISTPHVITLVQNYHWNNARGSRPGTIALRSSTGAMYGPWQTKGMSGQGGVPNASWICYPNITIPAGSYTIIDSEPSTWAQNSQSGGRGFTRMDGYPVGTSSAATPTSTTRTPPVVTAKSSGSSVIAEFKNASRENVHIFTEGESFSPSNRLTPGEKRKVTVRLGSGGRITFKAGRSGKVLATASWQGDAGQSGRVPVVTFDDSNPFGMLSVTTGLR